MIVCAGSFFLQTSRQPRFACSPDQPQQSLHSAIPIGTFRNYSCQGPEHTSYHTPPCMHTRTHTHAHVHMQHTCTHTPMPSHVRTHTCTHARMHTYMHTPPCTHTGAHIPMHTCTHAHAAHVHSHTHVSVLESSGSNPPLCMCGI